jgi:N-methylhydantoinase B
MNNISIGGWDQDRHRQYAYYETIGGGMGARPHKKGADAVHTHMTNTLNTPVEALEFGYPFRIKRYAIRKGSGGQGRFRGGDGICREIELLQKAKVTLLSDRRRFRPYGLSGGKPGELGRNVILQGEEERELPGKTTLEVEKGFVISIQTPGGGGHGAPDV